MRNYLLSIHSVMLLVMLAILSACKLDPSVAVSAGKSTPASLSLTGHELGVRETGEEFDFSITLKNNGIRLVAADKETLRQLLAVRDQKTVPRLVGTAFSKGIYEAAIRLLTDFRAKPAAGAAAK